MNPEVKEELRVRTPYVVFEIAAVSGEVSKLCKEFAIERSTYYNWKKRYDILEKSGLYRHKPTPYSSPKRTQPDNNAIEDKKNCYMGDYRFSGIDS